MFLLNISRRPHSIRTHAPHVISLIPLPSDLLEDSDLWPEEFLRDLCKKLVLQDSGSRDEVIARLRLWHVSKHRGQAFQGSNFYLLPVKDKTVLPRYMSPFKRILEHERKSILRSAQKRTRSPSTLDMRFSTPSQSPTSRRRRASFDTDEESDDSSTLRIPETSPKRGKHGNRKRKKGVQFSPYNRVQLISPRKAGDNEHVRQLYQSIQEGTYENSEDEEEEWARSLSASSCEPSPTEE